MEGTGESYRTSYRQFLKDYCESQNAKSDSGDIVPIRVTNPRVRDDELEGECLEWCLSHLQARTCPVILSAALAHETYRHVSESSLEQFLCENENKQDRVAEDDDDLHDNQDGEHGRGDNADEIIIKEYSSESLHQFVLETMATVCKTWAEELPSIPHAGQPFDVQYHAIKNTRRKMEDSHVIIPDMNALFGLKDHPKQSFYAIYDGHAGVDAATYAAHQLHCNLVRQCSVVADPAAALRSAFKVTDEAFCKKAKAENWRSGTTGVSCLIRDKTLYLAWLGDSQALLVRDGRPVTHMEPHKPDREDERDRIEALGGMVVMMGDLWRVGGNLAVSRAIGDANYKPFISSDADVLTVPLDGTEDYLVLACDGAWDVIQDDELPRIVYNHVLENGGDLSGTARMLVHYAKEHDSTDNISVIVIFFRDRISEPQAVNLFDFLGSASQDGPQESGADNADSKGGNPNSGSASGGDKDLSRRDNSRDGNKDASEAEISYRNGEWALEPDNSSEVDDEDDVIIDVLVNSNDGDDDGDETGDHGDNDSETDIDLDYYGIFDTRRADGTVDISHYNHIPNSSNLLKDIAESMYSGKYDVNLNDKTSMEAVQAVPVCCLTPGDIQKENIAREDSDINFVNKQMKNRKLGMTPSPICWAFTGRNKVRVQNHRLNLVAQTSNRLLQGSSRLPHGNPNPSQSLDKSLNVAKTVKMNNSASVSSYKPEHKRTVMPPKSVRAPPTSAVNSRPMLTVFGSRASVTAETKKFHSTWRPRRPLKPLSSVVYESPPTPFIHSKLPVTGPAHSDR